MPSFSTSAFGSTDPKDVISLIIIIMLIGVLLVGVIGHHLGYDNDDDNPRLKELNQVFHQPDIENPHALLHSHSSHTPAPLELLNDNVNPHQHHHASYVGKGHHGHRSKSLHKKHVNKGHKYWDDHLSNLNTPQIISTLIGISPQERKIALESLTVLQASRIVTVVNENLAKKDYWRPDLSDLLGSARVIPHRTIPAHHRNSTTPNFHMHHTPDEPLQPQKEDHHQKSSLALSSKEKGRLKETSLLSSILDNEEDSKQVRMGRNSGVRQAIELVVTKNLSPPPSPDDEKNPMYDESIGRRIMIGDSGGTERREPTQPRGSSI